MLCPLWFFHACLSFVYSGTMLTLAQTPVWVLLLPLELVPAFAPQIFFSTKGTRSDVLISFWAGHSYVHIPQWQHSVSVGPWGQYINIHGNPVLVPRGQRTGCLCFWALGPWVTVEIWWMLCTLFVENLTHLKNCVDNSRKGTGYPKPIHMSKVMPPHLPGTDAIF